MSSQVMVAVDDFESGVLDPWVVISGSPGVGSGDFSKAVVSNSSFLIRRSISGLGFSPKYLTIYISLSVSCSSVYISGFHRCAASVSLTVRALDSSLNQLVSKQVSLGASCYSTVPCSDNKSAKYIWVLILPSNTSYIEIEGVLTVSQGNGSGLFQIDNIYYIQGDPYVIRVLAGYIYGATQNLNIPINISGYQMMFSMSSPDTPPTNTSVSVTLNYKDPSNASRATGYTDNRVDANSMDSLSVSLSVSDQDRRYGSYRVFIPLYRRDNGYLLTLLIIYLELNANPQQPPTVVVNVPNPALNYQNTSNASLLVNGNNLGQSTYRVKFSLSCSGDCTNIQSASISIEILDPSNNVVDSDSASISASSITDFSKTITLSLGVTYTITYRITIDATPTQTTYLNITMSISP